MSARTFASCERNPVNPILMYLMRLSRSGFISILVNAFVQVQKTRVLYIIVIIIIIDDRSINRRCQISVSTSPSFHYSWVIHLRRRKIRHHPRRRHKRSSRVCEYLAVGVAIVHSRTSNGTSTCQSFPIRLLLAKTLKWMREPFCRLNAGNEWQEEY